MILTRRTLFGLLAAPAIVKAASLMHISAWAEPLALKSPIRLTWDVSDPARIGGRWFAGGRELVPGSFSIDDIVMTKAYLPTVPSDGMEIIVPSKPDWGPSAPPEFALPYIDRREAMLRRVWPGVRAAWLAGDPRATYWVEDGAVFVRYPDRVMCDGFVLERWL